MEDVSSPIASVNPIINPHLTPVDESKLPGNTSTSGAPPRVEDIPVVDKAVDTCAGPSTSSMAFNSDSFSLRNITMELGGLRNRITAWLIVLIVSFVAVLRSVPSRVTASLSSQAISRGNYSAEFPQEIEFLEEF
jgi:hypothetical protein